MSVYAGKIVELRLGEYDDKRKGTKESILNIIIETSKKLVGDINIKVKRAAVLFNEMADKANAQLSEGDYLLLNEAVRNPRIYTTSFWTEVETVEVNVTKYGSFKKLTRKSYKENREGLSQMMIQDSEFEFTDKDRAKIHAVKEGVDSESLDDDDVDEVFA